MLLLKVSCDTTLSNNNYFHQGMPFLCKKRVRRFLDIPKDVTQVDFLFHDRPGKNRIKISSNPTLFDEWKYITVEGTIRRYVTWSQFSFMIYHIEKEVSVLYVEAEYEEDAD